MRYIPATDDDIRKMMDDIGIRNFDELFAMIPEPLRFRGKLSFPKALSEQDLHEHMHGLAAKNVSLTEVASFLGGGAYHHYVPALIDALLSRGEFMTSYTPYQPEISQGTLQAIFEFQTYVCQITGLDVANASLYDGASAVAEAVLMARRIKQERRKILLSHTIHPSYRKVISTYAANLPVDIIEVGCSSDGRVDRNEMESLLDETTICMVVQSPNYLGVIENQSDLFERVRQKGALSICAIAEALSLGILKSPGECGADLAAGEGQSLGLPAGFGGPNVGFLATRQSYVRSMPGRLVGMAHDKEGRRGFVLTLAAREQHIRREKATSNICTNQGLCALAVTIYLSFLGSEGFRNLAARNLQNAHYAREVLTKVAPLRFSGPHFNEFTLKLPGVDEAVRKLESKGIFAGIPLGRYYPEWKDVLLVCVTEMTKKEQIDRLAAELESIE